ncbi:MAG: hypothetical protein LBU34_16240 [Planctomycetaceae bacterium]|jgi:hypothetical protein|nr:hypothetical protein [Planctomycetaceae bacterium]
MIFPEFFYFLPVFFLMKFQKLSAGAGKTVSKKSMNGDVLLIFLIFKTLSHSVLTCFRFLWFLCRKLFRLAGNSRNFFIDAEIPFLPGCRFFRLDILRCNACKNLSVGIFSGLYDVSGFSDCFFVRLVCFFRDSKLIVQRQSLWKQYNGLQQQLHRFFR